MHWKCLIIVLELILMQTANCLHFRTTYIETGRNVTYRSVEEIPCFTLCISAAKGWFNVQANKWNKQKISEELGANMYNYCRFVLNRPNENICDFAHQGLMCLQQAEQNIPLIKAALFGCTLELNITSKQLAKYIPLQPMEKIPCYFECFARKMELYDTNFEWNVDNWIKAFGSPYSNISFHRKHCKATDSRMRLHASNCSWMYSELICVDYFSFYPINPKIDELFL